VRAFPSLLTLTLASTLTAQAPGGGAAAVGTAYDSVRLRPMAGARIRLDSSDLVAVADADGRFRIEGIPAGPHYFRIEHPILDTLGIALRSGTQTYGATDTKIAELATPSPEALVEHFCTAAWRARGPAALVGRVREADTGKPAAGAKVSLLWFEIEVAVSLRRAPRVREATVSPDGTYRICGLPAELEGKAQVIRGKLTSGDVPVIFGHDVLALRSMSIAPLEAVVVEPVAPEPDSARRPAAVAPARFVGSARLTGRVVNRVNQPIVGARVQLEGTTRVAETRANGEFLLDSLPPGTQTVTARKLGYSPVESAVDLSSREVRTVTLSMPDFVPVLEAVRVNARRERALDDVGYARRKRTGNGWYSDGNAIADRTALNFSDVMRSAPGISIQQSGNRQVITSSRDPSKGCVSIWVDGTLWQQLEPGDIDDFVKPAELVALEVYSASTTPAEYVGASRGGCTTVVVWTVRKLDRKKP